MKSIPIPSYLCQLFVTVPCFTVAKHPTFFLTLMCLIIFQSMIFFPSQTCSCSLFSMSFSVMLSIWQSSKSSSVLAWLQIKEQSLFMIKRSCQPSYCLNPTLDCWNRYRSDLPPFLMSNIFPTNFAIHCLFCSSLILNRAPPFLELFMVIFHLCNVDSFVPNRFT